MKRTLLFVVLGLTGCDWAAAENKARCTAGEAAFCDGGVLPTGGGTGGGMTGGGTGGASGGGSVGGGAALGFADAGRVDTVIPGGASPFSLEEGPNGMVWVISERPGWSYVSAFTGGNVTLMASFDAGFTASHADPLISPALLLTSDTSQAGTGFPDGGVGPSVGLLAPASLAIQFPAGDGGIVAAFWLRTAGTYQQYSSPGPLLTAPTLSAGPVGCSNLQLHDVAVVLGDGGCCAVVSYSGSCTQGSAANGIDGGSGFQLLAVGVNAPSAVKLEDTAARVMVGRSAQGFDVASNAATRPIVFRRYRLPLNQTAVFSVTEQPGPLTLGDVSDGFMSMQALGGFALDTTPLPPINTQSAIVMEPATRRVFLLGESEPTRIPILALQGRVLVLWKRGDGELVLTQFTR